MKHELKMSSCPKIKSLAVVLGVSLTLVALADLVVPAIPPIPPQIVDSSKTVKFQAGQPASAEAMNQTIQELLRVIDSNGKSLQQLKDQVETLKSGRVATLESQVTALQPQVAGLQFQVTSLQPNRSVAGRKYKVAQMILLIRRNSSSNLYQRFADNLITLTFNSNGTVTGTSDYKERGFSLSVNTGGMASLSIEGVKPEMENFSDTYTQVGNTVTAFGETYYVSPDGRSIIGHKGTGENGQEGTILTGVEVTNN